MESRGISRRTLRRVLIIVCILAASGLITAGLVYFLQPRERASDVEENYTQVFLSYTEGVLTGEYEALYPLLSASSRIEIDEEAFLSRLSRIYAGIEASNMEFETLEIINPTEGKEVKEEEAPQTRVIRYRVRMDTAAGPVEFTNEAEITAYPHMEEDGYDFHLEWDHSYIFPGLDENDTISSSRLAGERGSIFDRNGTLLAGPGTVKEVFIVPGKLAEDPAEDIAKLAEILGMTAERIEQKLNEGWVKPELRVPIKRLSESDITPKEQALLIPGVGVDDKVDRVYPLGAQAAHLTGYVRPITAEELDKRAGQRYNSQSVLGKVGLEALLEERIRGIDGRRIAIKDENGNTKEVLAEVPAVHGEDVTLTIDATLQKKLYEQLQFDKASTTVINPYTGEVLALLSTPAYDPNEFVLGVPIPLWEQWNSSPMLPLTNRFKSTYAPGSAFKPITAAIGLSTGAFTADENFGYTGRSWQKDSSWGGYTVTTLKEYGSEVILANALVYSDNIYFARAALKIGADTLAREFLKLGFSEELPFAFGISASSFGTQGTFSSEIDLADSGYGQGRVQVSALHMASLYSAFLHEGSMIRPYLIANEGTTYWKENVFTAEAASTVKDALVQVIESPNGTAHEMRVPGKLLAGKTGTAEIKDTKEDDTGTELGWFVCFPAETSASTPYLFVCMVEDVKGRGGSHYVIPIARSIYAP